MKSKLLILIMKVVSITLFAGLSNAIAQDSTWFKIATKDVGLDSARGMRIVIADVNSDNYPDLLWGTGYLIKNRYYLYLNVENPDKSSPNKRIFKDYTIESGINKNRDPEKQGRIIDCASFADVDNDGDHDLVNSIYYHRLQMYLGKDDPGDRSEVYLNDGTGKFTLHPNNGLNNLVLVDTLPAGLINATGLAFLDYDFDGKIDLYISTWFSDYAANLAGWGEYKMKDALLRGNGDGSFTLLNNSGIEIIAQPMYGVNVTDWDNDGWQDIITSPYCRSGGSLFKNMRNGTFADYAVIANYSAQLMNGDNGQDLCQWEANPADFDNDGDMDLLQVQVHGGYDAGEGRTHIAINQGASKNYRYVWEIDRLKRDAPRNSHLGDQGGTWFDIDNDGMLDVAIGQMAYPAANQQGQERLYILRQNAEHYFDDISRALGLFYSMKEAHSMEPVDFDLDGDQDLFVSHQIRDTIIKDTVIDNKPVKDTLFNTYMQIELLRNDIGNLNKWSQVLLEPSADCNRAAIGARIYVYSGKSQQIREFQAGLGHIAQQQQFLAHTGIGKYQVDSIKIRWPNKELKTSLIRNPPANTILKINYKGQFEIFKTWEGKKPVITFKNSILDFDSVDVGKTKTLEFYISNIGESDLKISNMRLAESSDKVFKFDSLIIAPLKPDSGYIVKVQFIPELRKHYRGTIIVKSDAINDPESYIHLEGFGFEKKPLIAVSDSIINFEPTWLDSTGEYNFYITNPGELPLTITDCRIDNDMDSVFSIPDAKLPIVIIPGREQLLELSFKPNEIKSYTAQLTINSDSYNNPNITIPISAICDGPLSIIEVDRQLFPFFSVEVGKSKDMPMQITNNGNSSLFIENITIFNNIDSVYSLPGLALPLTIKPSEKYELILRFAPKDTIIYDDSMKISSNAANQSELIIKIKGKGKMPATLVESVMEGDFAIYPNPAENYAFVKLNHIEGFPISVILNDMFGKNLKKFEINRHQGNSKILRLDVKDLQSGIYLLQISSATGNHRRFLVILRQ